MSKVDIHDEVWSLCEKLDLNPVDVLQLDISPTSVSAAVCKLKNGSKYVDPDTGEVAIDVRQFEVVT